MRGKLLVAICIMALIITYPLSALATEGNSKPFEAGSRGRQIVPQRMAPGSIIIYDDNLQPRITQGGCAKDGVAPSSDPGDALLKGLRSVEIKPNMTREEREATQWENRMAASLRQAFFSRVIPVSTEPMDVTIYPGMKVVYDELDGYISNIYYPDSNEPSGYSIHNIPTDTVSTRSPSSAPSLGQPYGTHSNVINFQYADDSFLGVGRATYFTGTTGNRNNQLGDYDCATQINLDYSRVGDKDVKIRNLNTNQLFTFYQADVGTLPDAVIDIWGLSNLRILAGQSNVTSVY